VEPLNARVLTPACCDFAVDRCKPRQGYTAARGFGNIAVEKLRRLLATIDGPTFSRLADQRRPADCTQQLGRRRLRKRLPRMWRIDCGKGSIQIKPALNWIGEGPYRRIPGASA
jgi:hypothetical protein